MRQDEELCIVQDDATIRDVVTAISATPRRPGCAAILSSDGTLAGIFTDGDMRRVFSKRSFSVDEPVSDYMGKSPKTVEPEQLVQEAMRVMSKHQVDQLLVINGKNQPIGLLDIQDLMAIRTR
jgi:arabinose-5-phosphate isomerase